MAVAAETDRNVGTRTVTPPSVEPGETATVRVEFEGVSGKLLLAETVSEDDVVNEVSPDPIDTIRVDDTLYVSWNLAEPTDVVLEYATTIASSATDGATVPFEGTVTLGDDSRPVGGRTEVEVVTDFFGRLQRQSEITHDDVQRAGERVERGELTHQQFERVYQLWQNDATFEPGEMDRPATTAGAGGGTESMADGATNARTNERPTGTQGMSRQQYSASGRTNDRQNPAGAATGGGQQPETTQQYAPQASETSDYSRRMNEMVAGVPGAIVMYIVYGVFSVVGFFVTAVLVDATADFVNIPAGGAVAFVAAALVTAGGVLATAMATDRS